MTADTAQRSDLCGSCGYAFARWIRGKRTKLWFRQCPGCGASERQAETPEQPAIRHKPAAAIPELSRSKWCPTCGEIWNRVRCTCGHTEADDYLSADVEVIHSRMEKFSRPRIASQVRGHILNHKAKQAGE
jgi:hypothetical protein